MAKKVYTIQDNGQVTLPIEFRKKYGLKKGDAVVFKETDEGLVISPREILMLKMLDEIGDELKANGVMLEDLIRDGRKIRGELLKEKYGIEADPEDD